MLRWSVQEARRRSGVGEATIRRLERAWGPPANVTTDVLARLQAAFEAEGVVFLPEDGPRGPGVRLDRYPGRVIRPPASSR
jgi:hypothetical protein